MRWQQGVTDVDHDAARKSTAETFDGGATMPARRPRTSEAHRAADRSGCATAATPSLRFRPNPKKRAENS